jgi:hypothetical protein
MDPLATPPFHLCIRVLNNRCGHARQSFSNLFSELPGYPLRRYLNVNKVGLNIPLGFPSYIQVKITNNMKKILTLTALATASLLIATKSDAQVYVHAHFGFPFRGPRVYLAPPVVYPAPAPVYQQPYADQGAYFDPNGYPSSDGMAYEDEFPGYAYYDFPAWNGHFRDYWYYNHYRPFFEQRYAGYFNGARFDRARFLGARYGRGYGSGALVNRGYAGGGYVNHGYANRSYGGGYASHGGAGGYANRGGGYHGGAARGGFSGHGGGYGHGRR